MADRFVPTRQPERVAGVRILGLRAHGEFEVVERIASGFSTATIGRLAKHLDVTEGQVLALAGIPGSTYHKRKRDRRPLSPDESSRVYRIARVVDSAIDYFEGDEPAARRWLNAPKVALGGVTPLAFARTPEGSDYVVKLLMRMEHGVIS